MDRAPLQGPEQSTGAWLVCPRPEPSAEATLLCVPHAGGGASGYRAWVRHLPTELELLIVAPPGREHRWEEPRVAGVTEYVEATLSELHQRSRRPLLLFGHSMGAVIAYQLALRLAQANRPPAHLFLSGRGFPSDLPASNPLHLLPDGELIQLVRQRYQGLPKELDEYPDLLEEALRVLREDLRILESFQPRHAPRLEIPVSVMWGDSDPGVSRDDLLRWRQITTGPVDFTQFPGGHFHLLQNPGHVIRLAYRAWRATVGSSS